MSQQSKKITHLRHPALAIKREEIKQVKQNDSKKISFATNTKAISKVASPRASNLSLLKQVKQPNSTIIPHSQAQAQVVPVRRQVEKKERKLSLTATTDKIKTVQALIKRDLS